MSWRVPPLLAVNKHIRDEFGSYYFSKASFVILNSGLSTDSLGTWLKIIGNENLKHLANNGKVVVRFIFPWEEFTVSESYALRSLSYVRVITLDDAAHLTGLANEFQKLTQDYPIIWHWQLQSRDPINTYTRKDRHLPIRRFAREST
jgi:hypothetical protein